MKIALLQLLPGQSEAENLEKGEAWCRKAREGGADLALFPEMWSCGYDLSGGAEALRRRAVSYGGMFVRSFSRVARELEMAVGVTFLESCAMQPKNSVCLFDRFGREVLHYSKVHTCDFDEEKFLTAGEDFEVGELDTAEGPVRVGAMICFDREFPESARILMLKGAELILAPNACPMEINRLSQLRARAYENMVAIATCNYPDTVPDCNGGSSVFDGVAYLPELEDSRDTCLLQAGGEEGVYIATLDLFMLRRYRETEMQGNTYRRPHKYGLLTDTGLQPPFIRRFPRR